MANDVPAPMFVAVQLAWQGDELRAEDVPMWAAHWLADGHDGPALAELAGLGRQDILESRELLPAALAECGYDVADFDAAEYHGYLDCLARARLAGAVSTETLAGCVGLGHGAAYCWTYDNEPLLLVALLRPDEPDPGWDEFADRTARLQLDRATLADWWHALDERRAVGLVSAGWIDEISLVLGRG